MLTTEEKVQAINEYSEEHNCYDDMIYSFDEDTINEMFRSPFEAMRAAVFGDVNYSDDWFVFNGYGNLETLNDWKIDEMYAEIFGDDE